MAIPMEEDGMNVDVLEQLLTRYRPKLIYTMPAYHKMCIRDRNHIGSSAVEGVIAKPTIDMLLEIDGCCNVTRLVDALKAIGYGEAIFIRWDDPMKLLLGKGYSIDGYEERVFHLHVRYLRCV